MKNRNVLYFLFTAFKDILSPKIIGLLLLPFLGSALFWGGLTYFLWDWFGVLGISFFKAEFVQSIIRFLSTYFVIGQEPFVIFTNFLIIVGIIIPLAFISALIITSVFLVPVLVEEIRKKDFPSLLKKSNSIFVGTTASLSLSAKYFFSWVGTLPLWLIIPGGSFLVPFLLLSWFNSRLFTWEVMIEIASKEETKSFIENHSFNLWLLGLLTSTLYFVPVLNFIAPVITAAAFSRYCLNNKFNC